MIFLVPLFWILGHSFYFKIKQMKFNYPPLHCLAMTSFYFIECPQDFLGTTTTLIKVHNLNVCVDWFRLWDFLLLENAFLSMYQ